ncbi:hypothetical protein [Chlorella virus XW01]|nr:hypothetical protein [Chlorella virus XW01]
MVFFEIFQYNKEGFSETSKKPENEKSDAEKSEQLRKMLETVDHKVDFTNAEDYNKDYLALVGNIATSGIMKAKDFVKEDGSSVKEISLFPRNLKISDGHLEVNGKFTANGEFVVKNGDKVVHSVDKDGNMNIQGHLNTPIVRVGNHNITHPDNVDGAFYRADGQVQIATDDLVRVRHIGSKQTGIQLDARPGTGDMATPNGQMKITRQGIMFGGPNGAGKEVNSAQISAGRHVANSLNIVGMSSNNNAGTRRVDVWSENGMHVRSNHGLKVHGHGKETSYGSLNAGWSHMSTTAPQFYMNKSLQVNGGVSTYHNKPLHMPHGANITNRTTINDQATHIPLVVQSKQDSHIQLLAHNKPAESVYLINRNGGHFRVHSHGVGDTLHVNRDGHTFINSRGNHIPLHVQSANDAHIRLTGRNNGNLSTYLINRNGGNFMVHQHGVGDAFQVLRDGRARINHNTAHLPNANNYSMEIFTPQQDRVKETSIRFHQGNRYWHQLRADNTGFKMTTGNSGALSNLQVNSLISRNGVSLMADTRNDNLIPSAYRARAKAIGGGIKIEEFKFNNKIDLPDKHGTYCYLVTIVPWSDTSGGTIKQIAYADNSTFIRSSTDNDTKWGNWRINNETIIT